MSFCFETVFSHPSRLDVLGQAKALGYRCILVLIHLESSDLNLARISQRVSEGGHDVPPEKVISRIPRLLRHVRSALPLCDIVRVYDNSSLEQPFRPVFTLWQNRLEPHQDPLPDWAADLLDA